ncbi:hypothetical protein Sjap_002534 [Stephania japonica]|uniref:C3H1-type domain-containing protein n=1 Tax=Stephania japonica TaxID=461633 RepID=A0AAP0KPD2_9MAGN
MTVLGGSRRVQAYQSQKVCRFWRQGRCNRQPCPYLHNDDKTVSKNVSANQHFSRKWVREDDKGRDLRTLISSIKQCSAKKIPCDENPNAPVKYSEQLSSHCARANEASKAPQKIQDKCRANEASKAPQNIQDKCRANEALKAPQKIQDKCSENWMLGKCSYGDNCRYQHRWSIGAGFSEVIELSGHDKDVSAIVLPLASDKLFSRSKDGTLCIWDCNTGKVCC